MPRTKSIKPAASAIVSIAFCLISTASNAQKTYQCGSNFSQAPCAGGVERDVKDSRSEEQKKQSEKSAVTAAKAADTMEKSRQTQERQDTASNRGVVINAQPTPPDSPPPAPTALKKKKRQAPEHFTAQAPGEKKDKKKAKPKKTKDAPA